MLADLVEVPLDGAVGQDAAMDAGVERLDPAVEDLGKPGHVGHGGDGDPLLLEELERAAGGHDLDTEPDEPAGEVLQTPLVVHGNQGAARLQHPR
jgi:hypothetical protein